MSMDACSVAKTACIICPANDNSHLSFLFISDVFFKFQFVDTKVSVLVFNPNISISIIVCMFVQAIMEMEY